MVAGVGLVHGAGAVAFASDPRVQGGAMGTAGCAAIVGAYTEAVSRGVPIVGLWHSGGARLAEGVASLHAVGTVFAAMTAASGRVPQISVVLGPAAGGAAYGPALTDIVILSGQGRIFVTGPDVVRSVTGEDVDMERLGGPEPHSRRSGVVHLVTQTDAEALDRARQVGRCSVTRGRSPRTPRTATFRRTARFPPAGLRRAPADRKAARFAGRGTAPPVGAEHRDHPGPASRAHGRRGGQQPDAARRLPGRRGGGESGPLRPDVRRVRRAAGGAGGRAGLPARGRPGVGRRGPPRRQAPARVRRGHGAAGDAGDPQGVRRGLHRDELPLAGRDPRLRLAGRRGGRHGRGRGHPGPAPPTLASVPPERLHEAETALAAEHEATAGGLQRAVDSASSTRSSSPARPAASWPGPSPRRPSSKGTQANIRCEPGHPFWPELPPGNAVCSRAPGARASRSNRRSV